MKRFLSLIALAALLGTFSQANAFELRKSLTSDLQPKMSITEDDTGITVSYTFEGAMYWNNGSYSYGEPLPTELTSVGFNWNGKTTNILQFMNQGVDYVIHRDHGDINGWSNPSFTTENIYVDLKNNDAVPVVFSLNCSTGMFKYLETWITTNNGRRRMARPSDWISDDERSTCFAEAFLRKANGGAAGIIAASQLSYSNANEVLSMEMFQTMWPSVNFRHPFKYYTPDYKAPYSDTKILGKILNIGLANVRKYLTGENSNRNSQYNSMIYHYFGDPTMKFHDETPITLSIKRTLVASTNTFIYETGIHVLLSRINKETGNVSTCIGNRFVISADEFKDYAFYVNHDQITTLYLDPTSIIGVNENISIDKITYFSDNINIDVAGIDNLWESNIRIQSVDEPSCFHIQPIGNSNRLIIPTRGWKSGIYVVDLVSGDVIYDSKKIIIK